MLIGIDHVIIAVRDLDAAAAAVEGELGLRVAEGGRHEAHGTHNRLVWLGDAYIELMAVFDRQLAAASPWGRRALEVSAGGDGLLGLALASDDAVGDAARLRAMGSAIGAPVDGQRVRPDGERVRWRMAALEGGVDGLGETFLIEHDLRAAEWRPTDREARAAAVHPLGSPARLLRVEVPLPAVRATTQLLLRQLGLQFRPSLAGAGARETSIGPHGLRLVEARAGSRPSVVLRAGRHERAVELLGCRWELVPA